MRSQCHQECWLSDGEMPGPVRGRQALLLIKPPLLMEKEGCSYVP